MEIKTLYDINRLTASETETDSVEYKETTGQLERGMETLCAFLNKDGGTVLFGINDKKKVIGQEVADTTKRNIADAINRLEPAAAVQITYIPIHTYSQQQKESHRTARGRLKTKPTVLLQGASLHAGGKRNVHYAAKQIQ